MIKQACLYLAFICRMAACGSPEQIERSISPAPTSTIIPTSTSTRTILPTATHTYTPRATDTRTASPTASETPGIITLQSLGSRKNIQMGIYLTGNWLPDPLWQEIVTREFNLAVIAAGFYWDEIEPIKGQFEFSAVDDQVAFAETNQMAMCGHALLLAQPPYIPDWLAVGSYTKDDLSTILRNHITQVMSRYKGKIGMYIVVEDAPLPSDTAKDVFYKQFGYDYVDLAFQIAREADPAAILIYNADDNETAASPASPLTHQIVERLMSQGLIDGVGFEMHLDAAVSLEKSDVIVEMRSYGEPVYVTEMDVDLSRLPGNQEERYAEQGRIYEEVLSACLESAVCKSFSLWGIGDKYSWLRRFSTIANPTPFDDNLNPKPAYYAMLEALR